MLYLTDSMFSYPEDWGPLHSSQKRSEVRRNQSSCYYSGDTPDESLCHSPDNKIHTVHFI